MMFMMLQAFLLNILWIVRPTKASSYIHILQHQTPKIVATSTNVITQTNIENKLTLAELINSSSMSTPPLWLLRMEDVMLLYLARSDSSLSPFTILESLRPSGLLSISPTTHSVTSTEGPIKLWRVIDNVLITLPIFSIVVKYMYNFSCRIYSLATPCFVLFQIIFYDV